MLSQHLFCVTLILHFYNLSPKLGHILPYLCSWIVVNMFAKIVLKNNKHNIYTITECPSDEYIIKFIEKKYILFVLHK